MRGPGCLQPRLIRGRPDDKHGLGLLRAANDAHSTLTRIDGFVGFRHGSIAVPIRAHGDTWWVRLSVAQICERIEPAAANNQRQHREFKKNLWN